MDPFSITIGTVTLIGVCGELIKGVKLLRKASQAPQEISNLIDELNDFQHVLTAVKFATQYCAKNEIGDLLFPHFRKAQRVIDELSDICGIQISRKGLDDDFSEKCEPHKVSHFKWTRNKRRIAALRERLKIIRLDLANQLAAMTLHDLSRVMSDLKFLANRDQFVHQDSDDTSESQQNCRPNTYEALPSLHTQCADDLEAQLPGSDLIVGEKLSTPVSVHALPPKPSNRCEHACSCSCHSAYIIKTPSVLHPVIGSAVIKVTGTYGLRSDCTENKCRRGLSSNMKISYRFPAWLLDRILISVVASGSWNSPQISLMAPRIISIYSDVFHYAHSGNVNGLVLLFESGLASPHDVSAEWGDTPLHRALLAGRIDVCRFLLQAGARPDVSNLSHNTASDFALRRACVKKDAPNDIGALKQMFDMDECFQERQFTILHKIVLGLLRVHRDLDVELSASTSMINAPDSRGKTPLAWAAQCGHTSALVTLLRHGANPSVVTDKGWTALHYAAAAPTPACLSILLDHGASVTAREDFNETALHIAARNQSDPIYISHLLDYGADINARDLLRASNLSRATYGNNVRAVQCLIERGAAINSPNCQGATALNESIEYNYHECMLLLLSNGADPSILDHRRENALHVCARRADARTLNILISIDWKSIDPALENDNGLSARQLMERRLDKSWDILSRFEELMLKIENSNDCTVFFDAVETVPEFSELNDNGNLLASA